MPTQNGWQYSFLSNCIWIWIYLRIMSVFGFGFARCGFVPTSGQVYRVRNTVKNCRSFCLSHFCQFYITKLEQRLLLLGNCLVCVISFEPQFLAPPSHKFWSVPKSTPWAGTGPYGQLASNIMDGEGSLLVYHQLHHLYPLNTHVFSSVKYSTNEYYHPISW